MKIKNVIEELSTFDPDSFLFVTGDKMIKSYKIKSGYIINWYDRFNDTFKEKTCEEITFNHMILEKETYIEKNKIDWSEKKINEELEKLQEFKASKKVVLIICD